MKRYVTIALIASSLAYASGCSFLRNNPGILDSADEAAKVACIIANALLPNEKAVADACNLADANLDFVRKVMSAHKKELAKYSAMKCGEGGAP